MATRFNFQKPENVLKRADELINVGQSQAALQILHESIISKRYRVFSESHEHLMMRLVELCVLLRKGKIAKEALHAFKNLTMTASITSLENVVKSFLQLAEQKVAAAQEKAEKLLESVEDLESDAETPESIMLNSVGGQDTKGRTDQEVVMPWFKFLWETYRTVLDVTKNNTKLEPLYQSAAHQAFQFCLQYHRKAELRRLCELLRNHLLSLPKYSHQAHAINLNSPESMQMHLDTRFLQLNAAAQLELWQEAFRSIEDIHGLLMLSRKPPKAVMMVNFYEKLAKIFLVSDNLLFHAAGWLKYLALASRTAKQTAEEQEATASKVLLSVLAVPISNPSNGDSFSQYDETSMKMQRLTNLLGMSRVPTREDLLKEAIERQLLKMASPEVRQLYELLEVEFHPLQVSKKIRPIVEKLQGDPEYAKYIRPLYRVILTRLLQQLARMYSAVKFNTLLKMIDFAEPHQMSRFDVERFILEGCRRGEISVRVNHKTDSLQFDVSLFGGLPSSSSSVPPTMVVDNSLRTQLSVLASGLYNSLQMVEGHAGQAERKAKKQELFAKLLVEMKQEYQSMVERKKRIERKKQLLQKAQAERELEEAKERAIRAQQEAEAEKQRLEEEARRREMERRRREKEEIDRKQAQKLAEEMKKKNVKIEIESLETLDKENLRRLQIEQLEAERKELSNRIKTLTKRIDHVERAYRKEEAPLLKKAAAEKKEQDKKHHEESYQMLLEATKRQHAVNLEGKKRMARMADDVAAYRKRIEDLKGADYRKKKAEMEAKIAEEKTKRIAEIKAQKEKEAKLKAEEEKERKREEEEEERLRKEQEEQEAERQAELEKEREERELKRQREEELLRQRLLREQEAEENRRKRLEQVTPPRAFVSSTASRVETDQRPRAPALDWEAARNRRVEPAAQAASATPASRYVPPSRKAGVENTPPQSVEAKEKPQAYQPPSAAKYEPPKGKFVPSAAYRPPSAGKFAVGPLSKNGSATTNTNTFRRSGPTMADGKPATPDDSDHADNNGSDDWTTVKRK